MHLEETDNVHIWPLGVEGLPIVTNKRLLKRNTKTRTLYDIYNKLEPHHKSRNKQAKWISRSSIDSGIRINAISFFNLCFFSFLSFVNKTITLQTGQKYPLLRLWRVDWDNRAYNEETTISMCSVQNSGFFLTIRVSRQSWCWILSKSGRYHRRILHDKVFFIILKIFDLNIKKFPG